MLWLLVLVKYWTLLLKKKKAVRSAMSWTKKKKVRLLCSGSVNCFYCGAVTGYVFSILVKGKRTDSPWMDGYVIRFPAFTWNLNMCLLHPESSAVGVFRLKLNRGNVGTIIKSLNAIYLYSYDLEKQELFSAVFSIIPAYLSNHKKQKQNVTVTNLLSFQQRDHFTVQCSGTV